MSTAALQLELIAVKQQLAQAQLIQDKSDTANKFAENAQAKLLEQMEKNYTIANRVQAEKAKRQESDHYIKGLRDQMREATTRAMRVASELEREKTKNTELRNQMARSKKNKLERLRPYNYDDNDDSDLEQDEDEDDDDDEKETENIEQQPEENNAAPQQATDNTENSDPQLSKMTKPKRKRKFKRGKKKRRKQQQQPGSTTTGVVVPRLTRRPSTSSSHRASHRGHDSEKLRLAKSHSTDLFHRLADAKRSAKTARGESEGKYSKRRRSNVAVMIVRVLLISSFLFYCFLLNHSFQTNPNKITNCFQLILSITTTLLLSSL